MYVIREVMNCKPGKVGELKKKFIALNAVLVRMGEKPFRLLTDVSAEQFWTLVIESDYETLDAGPALEARVMGESDAQQAMSGYHDLVVRGRREIYRIET
jgi:hypothetical protein